MVTYGRSVGSALNWAAGATGLWLSRGAVFVGQSRGAAAVQQALVALFAPAASAVVVGVVLNAVSPISWYSDARLAFGINTCSRILLCKLVVCPGLTAAQAPHPTSKDLTRRMRSFALSRHLYLCLLLIPRGTLHLPSCAMAVVFLAPACAAALWCAGAAPASTRATTGAARRRAADNTWRLVARFWSDE